ncbi:MAG: alpha/beta hydrolase [Pseudomonadota bacterium]|nr:alpha/beta hydrolase [Pseudomonadota bacterium]
MIETWLQELPHGIQLSCRAAGTKGQPVLLFLHGFPEAAFVWDEMLLHFAKPENGGYRCVAPNLRGYEKSSQPQDVASYRAKFLVQDIAALIQIEAGTAPLKALVAHDWGGGVAWNIANQMPQLMQKLVILNSPHPGTFLRDLKSNPAQIAASAYMNYFCEPQAAAELSANQFEVLFSFLEKGLKPTWLTPEIKAHYLAAWSCGLQGGLNYYCASPLKPSKPGENTLQNLELPDSMLHIQVPTLLLWGLKDVALLPSLNEGLSTYIPQLTYVPIDNASHWVVHEQPEIVQREMAAFL